MAAAGMPARTGLTVQRLSPFGVFECADGYVAVVAVHEKLARGLFRAMGQPELGDDPRFANRDVRVANARRAGGARSPPGRSTLPRRRRRRRAGRARACPSPRCAIPEDALVDPRVVGRAETMPVVAPALTARTSICAPRVCRSSSPARATGFDEVLPIAVGEHNDRVYGDTARLFAPIASPSCGTRA